MCTNVRTHEMDVQKQGDITSRCICSRTGRLRCCPLQTRRATWSMSCSPIDSTHAQSPQCWSAVRRVSVTCNHHNPHRQGSGISISHGTSVDGGERGISHERHQDRTSRTKRKFDMKTSYARRVHKEVSVLVNPCCKFASCASPTTSGHFLRTAWARKAEVTVHE